jgi:RNA polymerase sigma-70 factor (TIGR02960 family)
MEESTLERARSGDSASFDALIEPHRRELLVHCYRTLGSIQDAEDVLQEVLLSAWRAIDRFDGRSLRAWLYRIATNRCLNFLRDKSRRPQPAYPPEPSNGLTSSEDPWWLEPYPDVLLDDIVLGPEAKYEARESIALSFVAGLQQLPAHQRTVLVLRDALGFPASEVAEILDTTTASVNSALVRARSHFGPDADPGQVPLARSKQESQVVDRFVDAFQRGDIESVVALLTNDARFAMPPEPVQCNGPLAVAEYLRARGFWGPALTLVPTRANNQPAFGYYLPDPNSSITRLCGLMVLTLSHDRISTITRFADKGLVARFGLPRTLPDDDRQEI